MKIKYILFALVVAFIASSCNDFLEEDPKGTLTPGTFFSSQNELDMATYALYKQVCGTQENTNPTGFAWQGDDITTNPGSNKQAYAQIDAFRPVDDNKCVEAVWKCFYREIKASNYIVLNAERTPTTQEEINIALGQAKYWRAVSYFRLVREFGPIPLVLDTDVNYDRPLNSVEEIYDQIVQDLLESIEILPTGYSSAPRYLYGVNVYVTKQAAQSTLAAVYMAMAGWPLNKTECYAKAAEQAKAVIDGVNAGTYEYILDSDFSKVYAMSNNYNNETVVGINHSNSFKWSEDAQFTDSNLFESLGGWGDGWGEIKFWSEFPAGPRKDAIYNPKILKDNKEGNPLVDWWDESIVEQHPMFRIFTVGTGGNGNVDYDYTKPADTQTMTNNHRTRLIRYSEVLLWYAESQARADGTPNDLAYDCVNRVRNRAGLADLQSGLSGTAFADSVAKEHGYEIAGYWLALVTRRDDQMRLNELEEAFNIRKENAPITVAPGVTRAETVLINDDQTWEGDASVYLPYPSSDASLNSNLKR
jgi:hypothetical protein